MHCMHQVIDEQTIDDLIKKIDGLMGAIQQFNISDHASDVSGQADLMHAGSGGHSTWERKGDLCPKPV